MARAARLKVYRTSAGFEDAYVAAPNQAAALKAWGARGDLFAIGEAEVVTDETLAAEALKRPGEVVRRPRGDMAAMLAAVPKREAAPKTKAKGSGVETRPPGRERAPPDRSALEAAERALTEARGRLKHDLEALAVERSHLDDQEARTRREGEAEVGRLQDAVHEAQVAFDKTTGS